jgi:hypothetical protein
MTRQRLALAWIACFAVLFNLLAMPVSSASTRGTASTSEQLLWGNFCSSNGTKLVAIDLAAFGQKAPQGDPHSAMQHCWCCSGSAPLVALPGHSPQLYVAHRQAYRSLASPELQRLTPRQQWPSLNPRASPLV